MRRIGGGHVVSVFGGCYGDWAITAAELSG